jgi:hypothetical protein
VVALALDIPIIIFAHSVLASLSFPLLVITCSELGRNIQLQKAGFIRDYISQFFLNTELYQTFHELIYTYSDDKFNEIEAITKAQTNLNTAPKPVFAIFDNLQNGRTSGARLYHPAFFQASPEERRLDALLGYLDVIAYYYVKGYLQIEDVIGSLGYFLAIMQARKVIVVYMNVVEEKAKEYEKSGIMPPFRYVKHLLNDVAVFNRKYPWSN